MIKLHNELIQGSQEWLDFRKGKLTASHATAIGATGAGIKTYCMDITREMCGIEKPEINNADIERGNEMEPIAITHYEMTTGLKVNAAGCITNSKYVNTLASPDGLVGSDGGIEVKARNDAKHYSLIQGETKEIPKNQIQMCLLLSEREWWDFISFNPNFEKSMFVKRIYPDPKYFEKLKAGFKIGSELIKQYLETYNKYEPEI